MYGEKRVHWLENKDGQETSVPLAVTGLFVAATRFELVTKGL